MTIPTVNIKIKVCNLKCQDPKDKKRYGVIKTHSFNTDQLRRKMNKVSLKTTIVVTITDLSFLQFLRKKTGLYGIRTLQLSTLRSVLPTLILNLH